MTTYSCRTSHVHFFSMSDMLLISLEMELDVEEGKTHPEQFVVVPDTLDVTGVE